MFIYFFHICIYILFIFCLGNAKYLQFLRYVNSVCTKLTCKFLKYCDSELCDELQELCMSFLFYVLNLAVGYTCINASSLHRCDFVQHLVPLQVIKETVRFMVWLKLEIKIILLIAFLIFFKTCIMLYCFIILLK